MGMEVTSWERKPGPTGGDENYTNDYNRLEASQRRPGWRPESRCSIASRQSPLVQGEIFQQLLDGLACYLKKTRIVSSE